MLSPKSVCRNARRSTIAHRDELLLRGSRLSGPIDGCANWQPEHLARMMQLTNKRVLQRATTLVSTPECFSSVDGEARFNTE